MIMNVNLSEDEKQKLVEFRKKYYRNYFLLQLYLKSSLKKYEKKFKTFFQSGFFYFSGSESYFLKYKKFPEI